MTRSLTRALGYLRVSTAERAVADAGLNAQRTAISDEADRQTWEIEYMEDAGYSARDSQRPALREALARLGRGDADVLVAAKLDRVSGSVADFAALLDKARAQGWRLVCLDPGVDTATASGELVSNMLARAAQYERRLIGQRTREGLAAKRAAGVRLGRPSTLPPTVVRRVIEERSAGASLRSIADKLTGDGVETAQGGQRWYASTVRAVLASQDARRLPPT